MSILGPIAKLTEPRSGGVPFSGTLGGMARPAGRLKIDEPVVVTGLDVIDLVGCFEAAFECDSASELVSPKDLSPKAAPVRGESGLSPGSLPAHRLSHPLKRCFKAAPICGLEGR